MSLAIFTASTAAAWAILWAVDRLRPRRDPSAVIWKLYEAGSISHEEARKLIALRRAGVVGPDESRSSAAAAMRRTAEVMGMDDIALMRAAWEASHTGDRGWPKVSDQP